MATCLWVKFLPLFVGAAGIGLAYLMYMFAPGLSDALVSGFENTHKFLVNKWYFDYLYEKFLVKPAFVLGRGLWQAVDGVLINNVGPDGIAEAVRAIARRAGVIQSGYLYHYAFVMLLGLAAFITWFLVRGYS